MTTHSTCWKVTRRDATVEGFTDHDRDLTVSGVTYKSSVGYAASAVERSSNMQADNQEVVGIIDTDNLSAADLRAGVYDGARVELLLVDWSTQTLVATLLVGHLGTVKVIDEQYTVDLQSIEYELSKPIGRVYGLRCDAELGDTRCGFALTSDSDTVGTVTTARRVFQPATGLGQAAGYYDGGKIEWTSGANSGRVMDVKTYTTGPEEIALYEPMPSDIVATDAFDIYQGCDKAFATCRDTFANTDNFRGFPYIPGVSDLISGQTETG